LIPLDDSGGHVLPGDADRLVAAIHGIDVNPAVVELTDLLPVLRLIDRLVPLRAALHRRLVGLERSVATQPSRSADWIGESRAPAARQVGMPVGVARRVAARLLLHDEAVLRRDALARGAVRRLYVAQRQVARALCRGRPLLRLPGRPPQDRGGHNEQGTSPTGDRALRVLHNS